PFYTVGQRKGLGIALGAPAYVLRLNPEKNTIVLGSEEELKTTFLLTETPEVVDEQEFFTAQDLTVRIRYHSNPVPCKVRRLDDGRMLVETAEQVSAVTPGQSAVFYIKNRLVGGAYIASQKGIGGVVVAMQDLTKQ
ncbi:MAG: tRNA 2-thiouridine(34) synthase MnmA, partial [Bacteroidaceae bacterium]|nr:tRNA 2-thiouridine(34) synthase MnmA [Bacteroidaceae bacterium]